MTWTELPGEGAFYGPKIEYHLKDSLGRPWQVGTMQVDFFMPERLGAEYVAMPTTARQVPVMLHRAIVGSMERFIGILIENYAGALPAVAGAGAGIGAEHLRCPGRICESQVAEKLKTKARVPRARLICVMRKLPIKYANIPSKNCPTSLW